MQISHSLTNHNFSSFTSSLCEFLSHKFIEETCFHNTCCNTVLPEDNTCTSEQELLRHNSSLALESLLKEAESKEIELPEKYLLPNKILNYNVLMKPFATKNKACMCKPVRATDRNDIDEDKTIKNTENEKKIPKEKPKLAEEASEHLVRSVEKLRNREKHLNDIIKETFGKDVKIIVCDGSCSSKQNTVASTSSDSSTNSDKCKRKNWFSFCKRKKTKNTASDQRTMRKSTTRVSKNSSRCNFCTQDTKTNTSNLSVQQENKQTKHLKQIINTEATTCYKCGRKDVQKIGSHCPFCKDQTDTLKLLIKMEAKQNYRQINSILQELAYQRDELRRLNDLFDGMSRKISNTSNNSRKFELGFETKRNEDILNEFNKRNNCNNCICEIEQQKAKLTENELACNSYNNCPGKHGHNIKLQKDIMNNSLCCASRNTFVSDKTADAATADRLQIKNINKETSVHNIFRDDTNKMDDNDRIGDSSFKCRLSDLFRGRNGMKKSKNYKDEFQQCHKSFLGKARKNICDLLFGKKK